MKLTIITTFFNTEYNIFKQLTTSISSQTCSEFEWIIVNDCSDGKYTVILEDCLKSTIAQKYILINNETNIGAAQSRNVGLKKSSGEYIVFVDSDDYVETSFVSSINECAKKNYPDIIFFDYIRESSKRVQKCKTITTDNLNKENILLHMTTNVCGKAIKASIIRENALIFPNLQRYEDWCFMVNAVCVSNTFYYLENKHIYYYLDNPKSVVHKYKNNGSDYAKKAFDILESIIVDKKLLEPLYIREVLYTSIRDKICVMNKKDFLEHLSKIESRVPNWKQCQEINNFTMSQKIILKLYKNKLYYIEKALLKLLS